MAHRRPAAQERRSTAQERRSTAKASAPPSTGLALPLFGAPDHRHRELIPPFGYRRDVLKANVVAVFERLAQFRNTLRDDVAGHNVPGPDVFDKLVPAEHFPRMAGKKTRRSIKRGSRVSWRPFLLIWFTEGVTSHSPTRTTGCSIQESPRQKGKGAMITHLSYLFLPGSLLRH